MMSLTFGLFTQVSGSGPLGPLVYIWCNNRYGAKVSISNILLWPIGHKGKKLCHKVKS